MFVVVYLLLFFVDSSAHSQWPLDDRTTYICHSATPPCKSNQNVNKSQTRFQNGNRYLLCLPGTEKKFEGDFRCLFSWNTIFELITALCALVGTLFCGKIFIYLLRIHYKRDQKKTYLMMIMQFFLIFFINAYVVGTHLNCINKSMLFKWVPTTYAFIKKYRQNVHWL